MRTLAATVLAPTVLALTVLALTAASVPALAAQGDVKRGEEIYQRCKACHALDANRVGPRHCGLFGRKAGTAANYQYSPAMKKYGATVTWDEETLNHFLENPMKVVPGTKMGYAGVKDPQERADLITYLKHATADPKNCD